MGNDVSKLSVAELQALLEQARVLEANEKATLAQPFVESLLPHTRFATNEKGTWHGATFETKVTTEDGREIGVRVFLTDVQATKDLKAAAKNAA